MKDYAEFRNAYIECMLWADSEEENSEPYNVHNFSERALGMIGADCIYFYKNYSHLFIENGARQAGHDFWLTRQGHGCGFWDGDWPQNGEALDEAARKFSSICLVIGDDGKIYFE